MTNDSQQPDYSQSARVEAVYTVELDGGDIEAQVSSFLPYILAASRFAHYIKVIVREKIGSYLGATAAESAINGYIADNSLDPASVAVTETAEGSGVFEAVAVLRHTAAIALGLVLGLGATPLAAEECSSGKNQIDYAAYFHADVRDAEECSMHFEGGRVVISDAVSNPAMTCPDMFSWKLFVDSVLDGWWTRWADESQNWPPQPLQLCHQGQSPAKDDCCRPGDPANSPEHCPHFPGGDMMDERMEAAEMEAQPRRLRSGITPEMHGLSNRLQRLIPAAELDVDGQESLGRIIRQDNSELTVRNAPFHEYLFVNNLYNAEGIIDVFTANAGNIAANAPYRRTSTSAEPGKRKADLARIDLPTAAIMIKSNWLAESLGKALGIQDDPKQPFIKKRMADADGSDEEIHWLVAFHVSSKDIPNWVWTTFEHVAMPGRCDFTGCNDSYGHRSSDELPKGVDDNFIAPRVRCDDLVESSWVFDRDQLYPAGAIRPGLAAVFEAAEIGTRPAEADHEPTAADRAWRSYRLKGSQVEFVDSMGRATFLGNSITEAGFMNGSSCITCHARAGADEHGVLAPGIPGRGTFPLSVFENILSDYGYGLSSHGVPVPDWFHQSNQPPNLEVLQVDFVWGFLNARPVASENQAAQD